MTLINDLATLPVEPQGEVAPEPTAYTVVDGQLVPQYGKACTLSQITAEEFTTPEPESVQESLPADTKERDKMQPKNGEIPDTLDGLRAIVAIPKVAELERVIKAAYLPCSPSVLLAFLRLWGAVSDSDTEILTLVNVLLDPNFNFEDTLAVERVFKGVRVRFDPNLRSYFGVCLKAPFTPQEG